MTDEITPAILEVAGGDYGPIVDFIASIPVIGDYIPGAAMIMAGAAMIAAVWKTPKEGTLWNKIYTVIIDLPGMNIGRAKNKD